MWGMCARFKSVLWRTKLVGVELDLEEGFYIHNKFSKVTVTNYCRSLLRENGSWHQEV